MDKIPKDVAQRFAVWCDLNKDAIYALLNGTAAVIPLDKDGTFTIHGGYGEEDTWVTDVDARRIDHPTNNS